MGVKYWALFAVHHFHRFIVWLLSPIFHWLYDDAHRGLPPITDRVLMMRAVELAKNIRTRQVHFTFLSLLHFKKKACISLVLPKYYPCVLTAVELCIYKGHTSISDSLVS